MSLAPPLAAQVTGDAMTPQQFYDVGVTMMRVGKPQDAANVADALLMRDPSDSAALILRAEAAIDLGEYADGVTFGRRAYFATSVKNQKFAAARLVALAQSQVKNDTLAQLWLRRARQYAPDTATAKGVAEDYQFLRRRNPWSTQLWFGVTPSSNINNGSANSESDLLGLAGLAQLDAEARALSGLEISGGFGTRYKLRESQTAITFLTMSADARNYVLSGTARDDLQSDYDGEIAVCEGKTTPAVRDACLADISPVSTGGDFAYTTLSFGVVHRQIFREGSSPTDFTLKVGQMWYGGDNYSRFQQANIAQGWQVSEKNRIVGTLSADRNMFLNGREETLSKRISARWSHLKDNSDRFSFGVTLNHSTSKDTDSTYDSVTYDLGYDIAKPVYGMRFGFGLDYAEREYEYSSLAAGPRSDRTLGLNMSVELTEVEFYGFRPVVNLELRRNDSSLGLFDRDYSNLGFDLRSSF